LVVRLLRNFDHRAERLTEESAMPLKSISEVISLSRKRAAEGHIPQWQQVLEMLALRILRGVGPNYYQMAGFWRRGISWSDKLDHPSAAEYARLMETLSPPPYRKLSQNKIAEKALLTQFQIPTPRFLGRVNRSLGMDYKGRPLINAEHLVRLIQSEGCDRVVFKELEGYGGLGVRIAEIHDDGRRIRCRPLNQETFSPIEEYCNGVLKLEAGGDWLMERYLSQHPITAKLNPLSVNAVRIWILQTPSDAAQVIMAYNRVGRAHMFVDNATSGGMVVPIDLATGTLLAALEACPARTSHPTHPDHGATIEGVRLPYWEELQALAIRALTVFPNLYIAGLDVAITESGPAVLELNVIPDREGAAYTDRTTRSLLFSAAAAVRGMAEKH
jgi:hypothetical protein